MKQRFLSGMIMTLIVVPFILIGGYAFRIGISILSVLAYKELLDLKINKNIPTLNKVIGVVALLLLVNLGENLNVLPLNIIAIIIS